MMPVASHRNNEEQVVCAALKVHWADISLYDTTCKLPDLLQSLYARSCGKGLSSLPCTCPRQSPFITSIDMLDGVRCN